MALAGLAMATPMASAAVTHASSHATKSEVAVADVTICLLNYKTFCADVKDSKNANQQPIWLGSTTGDKDYHWKEVPQVNCGAVNLCYNFEDAQDTSLCLSSNSTNSGIVLDTCNTLLGGWYYEGGDVWGNVYYGSCGTLSAVAPPTSGEKMAGACRGTKGVEQTWTGP
jgi:hypothetical protein